MVPAFLRAAIILAALLLPVTAPPAQGQDVTLRARDGGLSLEGTLLSYDGAYYRVETIYGELTVDAQGVDCEGPGCPDLTSYVAEFTIAGSPLIGNTLVRPLVEDFARRRDLHTYREEGATAGGFTYVLLDPEQETPVARIRFALDSSDAGLVDLLEGEADMAMSFSPLNDPSVHARVIALDAFVPMVAPDSPVSRVTLGDLAAVLSGGIGNWTELGGPDMPVALHAHAEDAGVQQALEAQLLGPRDLPMAPDATRHATARALDRAVGDDPFALGVGLASQRSRTRALALSGACGFEQTATPLAIKAEDYPLTVPVVLHTRAERLSLMAREMLNFIASPEAQRIIRRTGFIDQAPERVALDAQGTRLANAIAAAGEDIGLPELQRLVSAMKGTRRLSPTFRFAMGETELDAQSRGNVESLARALEAGLYDGRELVFAGFTDGEGATGVNQRIARERATAVREAVRAAAPLMRNGRATLSVMAFGEAMPMACDDTEHGRRVNRRVEVWLR